MSIIMGNYASAQSEVRKIKMNPDDLFGKDLGTSDNANTKSNQTSIKNLRH